MILTILLEVVPWLVLVISLWPQLSNLQISFTVLGLVFITDGFFGDVAVVVWPFSLVLVWPAALIMHDVWKRRKAKKTTYAKGEQEDS